MLRLLSNKSFNNNIIGSYQRMVSVTKHTIQENEIQPSNDKQNNIKSKQSSYFEEQNKDKSIKNDKNTEKKDVKLKKAIDKMNDILD